MHSTEKKNSLDDQVGREQQPVIAVSAKEQQKEYYRQQAGRVLQACKDYRDCPDKLAILGDDYARMDKLLSTINRTWFGVMEGLQVACHFYALYSGRPVEERKMVMNAMEEWTRLVMSMAEFSDFIDEKCFYYEQQADELTGLVREEWQAEKEQRK